MAQDSKTFEYLLEQKADINRECGYYRLGALATAAFMQDSVYLRRLMQDPTANPTVAIVQLTNTKKRTLQREDLLYKKINGFTPRLDRGVKAIEYHVQLLEQERKDNKQSQNGDVVVDGTTKTTPLLVPKIEKLSRVNQGRWRCGQRAYK